MTNILHTSSTGMSMGGLFAMIYERVDESVANVLRHEHKNHFIRRLDVIGLVSVLEFRTERAGDSYRRSTTGVFPSPIPT